MNTKLILLRLIDYIRNNWPLWFLITLLCTAPCVLNVNSEGIDFPKFMQFIHAFVASIFPSFVLFVIAWWRKWLKILIVCVLWMLLFIDFYLAFSFQSLFDTKILLLILQTNPYEASEFLSIYLLTFQTFWAVLICAGIAILYCSTIYINSKILVNYKFTIWGSITVNIISLVVFILTFVTNTIYVSHAGHPTILRLTWNIRQIATVLRNNSALEKTLTKADAVIEGDPIPTIIMIIGESFNRNHSSLYGYPLPTNPNLQKEFNNGNLLVFKDVVSNSSATIFVTKSLISPSDISDPSSYYNQPLLQTLFKKAGYFVVLSDNQSYNGSGDLFSTFKDMQPFNSKKICKASLDYKNSGLDKYDAPFIDSQMVTIDSIHSLGESPLFITYHLKGQHIRANERYEPEFSVFGIENYTYRNISVH